MTWPAKGRTEERPLDARPIEWRSGPFGDEQCVIVAPDGTCVGSHRTVDIGSYSRGELVAIGEQPAVYVWVEEVGQRQLAFYVGQTLNLLRRTEAHLNTHERGAVGREVLYLHDLGRKVRLYFWLFACDCPLDYEEATLIALLKPRLNISPGNLGRGPECDEFCYRKRRAQAQSIPTPSPRPRPSPPIIEHEGPLTEQEREAIRAFTELHRRRSAGQT